MSVQIVLGQGPLVTKVYTKDTFEYASQDYVCGRGRNEVGKLWSTEG